MNLLLKNLVVLSLSVSSFSVWASSVPKDLVDQCSKEAQNVSIATLNAVYPSNLRQVKAPFKANSSSVTKTKKLGAGYQGEYVSTYQVSSLSSDGYDCSTRVEYHLRLKEKACRFFTITLDHCAK
jgi:hypothetical protein